MSYQSINYQIQGTPVSIDMEYDCGGFSILLPEGHALPFYQQRHPRYDRFLPHLCRFMEAGAMVIDVGANVGDSFASMASSNPNLQYFCIEPDPVFFAYLKKNIERVTKQAPVVVAKSQSFVGKAIKSANLEGQSGTRHAVVSESGDHASVELDELLLGHPDAHLKLLKTDVDGFDWDIINSAEKTLSKHQPLIFFECQYDSVFQKENYERTIQWLTEMGYADWTVFDNFGAKMFRTDRVEQVLQVMSYIWEQNCQTTTRTIYYCDILVATAKDRALVDAALAAY